MTGTVNFLMTDAPLAAFNRDKDRLVYLSKDLNQLLKGYWDRLKNDLNFQAQWVFPSKYPEQHLPKTSVDKKFKV